jgi:hypothetical protein
MTSSSLIRTIAAGVGLLLASGWAPAGPPAKSVLDYYRELPDEIFQCESAAAPDRAARERLIIHHNVPHGYIRALVEGFPLEVTLFREWGAGRDIIAVSLDCGDGCMCRRLDFLVRTESGWRSVRDEIFPATAAVEAALGRDAGYAFQLPETGTTIRVVDADSRTLLLTIPWDGRRFNLSGK